MDISLLYILLRNFCGIKAHSKGWGNRSVSAKIDRIRLVRNRCDYSTGGLSKADLNQIWSEVRAAVVDLDKVLGNTNKYQEAVDFVQNDTMDPEQMKDIENITKSIDSLKVGIILYVFEYVNLIITLKVLDSLFFCIPEQTEENDKLAKHKMQKLESMVNLIISFFLKRLNIY